MVVLKYIVRTFVVLIKLYFITITGSMFVLVHSISESKGDKNPNRYIVQAA